MAEMAGGEICRLPEECIVHAISLTSPGDACLFSADSDVAVWEHFLPSDYISVLSRADEPVDYSSKKELFSRLCDHPVLLDGGIMSFGLERRSGAKCYMLSARALNIAWGDEPLYWRWTSLPGSRFSEVAELLDVCWLEITGKIQCALLSPRTTYAAYLVFIIADDSYGLECNIGIRPPKASVTISGGKQQQQQQAMISSEHAVCLQHLQGTEGERAHRRKQVFLRLPKLLFYGRREIQREADHGLKCPRQREDGWMEVEMGEFAVDSGEEAGEVEVSLKEVEGVQWKRGLIVQGIEIRPKY